MNLFLEIFRILNATIRLVGHIVASPSTILLQLNLNRIATSLEKVQSFLMVLVLLMPIISLIICKIVREDAYIIKTKIWLFTLLLPIIYVPLRFLITQVYLLILEDPINLSLQKVFTTEFLTYSVTHLIIAYFAFLFTFKRIKYFGNRKNILKPEPLDSYNESVEYHEKVGKIVGSLSQLMNIDEPETLILKLRNPIMFTMDEKKKKQIFVSTGLIELLDNEELEACLGHELAHIMNKDSSVRKMSSFLRAVMFYNPLGYFIESTIYCEREFLADMICSQITKKPEALASALIKIAENTIESRMIPGQTILRLFKRYKFLLRKHPPLEERLKRLMRLIEEKKLL
ncbi:MAG: M48 family metalloprotease [Candidatus Jordarchaeaceae archaeon]